ncbi:hypothetical protein OIU91_41135 (plasmid) [Streptomyces sp. NBC_01456]|uniref:hypothetical protein n=1 Tax=unclassified Streptomyces TaxID=2593676 RepID=UPI002E326730|nr:MULTISPECIES: hypothetical protein [unclassified Streptomyces]
MPTTPSPTTDLVRDVSTALAFLDENDDLDAHRDAAPAAYGMLQGRAVRAVRRLRDALAGAPTRYADPIAWRRAQEDQQQDAQGLALLIADTLRAQIPGAAYLVFHINDSYEAETGRDLELHSVRGTDGRVLHGFRDDSLPGLGLDRHRELVHAWRDAGLPRTGADLNALMQPMRAAGLVLDDYPEPLYLQGHPCYRNDTEHLLCMLLSDSAHPEQWDLQEVFGPQLLRPYGTPLPA